MPNPIIYSTYLPTGILDESAPSNEQRVPSPVRSMDVILPAFVREVEVDRLSEETLAYKEILVVLLLILFVLIRSLMV